MTRRKAQEANLSFYNTGKPCKHGHLSARYVKDTHCLECTKIKNQNWFKNNRDRHNELGRNWWSNNKEKREISRNKWRKQNLHKYAAYASNRRATVIRACSITQENHYQEILDIFQNCPTGFEVDHIVPLQGKTVCGLHVPWNLQYLTINDNRRKGNKLFKELAVVQNTV